MFDKLLRTKEKGARWGALRSVEDREKNYFFFFAVFFLVAAFLAFFLAAIVLIPYFRG